MKEAELSYYENIPVYKIYVQDMLPGEPIRCESLGTITVTEYPPSYFSAGKRYEELCTTYPLECYEDFWEDKMIALPELEKWKVEDYEDTYLYTRLTRRSESVICIQKKDLSVAMKKDIEHLEAIHPAVLEQSLFRKYVHENGERNEKEYLSNMLQHVLKIKDFLLKNQDDTQKKENKERGKIL